MPQLPHPTAGATVQQIAAEMQKRTDSLRSASLIAPSADLDPRSSDEVAPAAEQALARRLFAPASVWLGAARSSFDCQLQKLRSWYLITMFRRRLIRVA